MTTVSRANSSHMSNAPPQPPNSIPGLRYKNLGRSGLRVPNVALGLWTIYGPHIPEEVSEDIINYALDRGINMFDFSEAHSAAKAEIAFGKTLKKRGIKRSSIIITTKIYWSTNSDERGLSRKHIVESVQGSLERLGLDYIDVVLLHKADLSCPMEEMVRTMTYLINQGMALYWGTARWSPMEIMEAYTNCRLFNCICPIVEQTEYHMFCREKCELYMPELSHKIGIGLMVWSAITTGKGNSGEDPMALFAKSRFNRKYSTFSWCDDDLITTEAIGKELVVSDEPRTYAEKLRDLAGVASHLRCTMSQMAIAWCLKNDIVSCVLLGASSVRQLKDNMDALQQVVPQLSPAVLSEIDRVLGNKPVMPPMVSTLAMRNQLQQSPSSEAVAVPASNSVHLDLTTAQQPAMEGNEPTLAIEGGEATTPKDMGRGGCQVQ